LKTSLKWSLICASLAFLLSLPQLLNRYRAEQSNRAVEIVMEYGEIQELAAATGKSTERVLAEFKDAGVTGIVVVEDTVETLVRTGRLTQQYPQNGTAVWVADEGVYRKMATVLAEKYRWQPAMPGAPMVTTISTYGKPPLNYSQPLAALEDAGLGMPRSACADLKRMGFDVVGRVSNYVGADPVSVDWTLRDMKAAGCTLVSFLGTEVLGSRDSIAYVGDAIRRNGLRYAFAEFGKQAGDAKLLKMTADIAIRMHSILPAEMVTMAPADAIDRFAKAAKERNCRILYVRMFSAAAEDPVEVNANYVRSLVVSLDSDGMVARLARPITAPADSPFRWFAAVLAPLFGGLAVCRTLNLPLKWAALFPLPGLLADMMGVGPPHAIAALITAILFPIAATLGAADAVVGGNTWRAIGDFALACLVSLLGALAVASMISDLAFMMSANVFVGVKLAHVVPFLVVSAYLVTHAYKYGGLMENVRWWHLLIALMGLAVVFMLILRTGNENQSVSGSEMQFRSILDRLMPVRPRTKEFLFGHPLLVLGLLCIVFKRPRFVPLFLAAGAIGQASIVNTFCHIHTPLLVSLQRVLWGALLGGILGLALFAAYTRAESWFLRRWRPSSS